MITELCELCGGYASAGSTCPKAITCPRCGAVAGSRCHRPSGHLADTLHAERVAEAERRDLELGVTYSTPDSSGRRGSSSSDV